MPTLPDTAWFEISPDWVCEIISPSTHRHDRTIKRDIYAREKIGHYWIVDPVDKLRVVFELRNDHWVLILTAQDSLNITSAPFDAVPFD